jgi:predicted glycosyltransferase
MPERLDNARLLIYSHDSFGLGHLRRCRAIAHNFVEQFKGLSVLILSGSPIVGSFDYRARVDFVRVPGVIKLRNGEYTSLSLHIDVEDTLSIREAIIRNAAATFAPQVFLVDKEPLGLMGEIRDTLTMLKMRGTRLVLGVRDIIDDPNAIAQEWERKNVRPALASLYDDIWIYGAERFWHTLDGLDLPPAVTDKITYTGYLRRPGAEPIEPPRDLEIEPPYLLVTPGGGGDGVELIDWVLAAYEADPGIPFSAFVVLGPFMGAQARNDFLARAACLPRVQAITFDARIERIMAGAAGVVAMGGYNTFCEILSFDKPALIVPRTVPRREQLIRASRAQDLGLARMLDGDGARDPKMMAEALRAMTHQSPPSQAMPAGLLDGLSTLNGLLKDRMMANDPAVAAAARARHGA